MSKYAFLFMLDETTDITDKIKSFTIESSLESFCRELSFDLFDETFYDTLDFSIIPETTRIEVFTSISEEVDEYDEYGMVPIWVSQGSFFIERPTFQVGINETVTGVWGRQSTAILGEPFAQKVTKLWSVDTSFYAICQEILESVGLTWDSTKCDIQDFIVYADTFEADDKYPIEVLQSLVELIVGAEGYVTSDKIGDICIKRLERAPTTSLFDLTDSVIQSIKEEPEWPEFGNRIKIIPVTSVSQNSIELGLSSECIGMDTINPSYIEVYAQAKNGEGVAINDQVVDWSFYPSDSPGLSFMYPAEGTTVSQNTADVLISKEIVKADSLTSLTTKFEASSIIGIWAYADKSRTTNFAGDDYVIDGTKVYITNDTFAFCDQTLVISYYASGMVINLVKYTPGGVLYSGDISIVASLAGKEANKSIYVHNDCKCTSSLSVTVDPSSVDLSSTGIAPETTETAIGSNYKVTTNKPIQSVSSVYCVYVDSGITYGGNIFASFSGNEITLLGVFASTWVKIIYRAITDAPINTATSAKISVSLENGGMPIAGLITMAETTGLGTLQWSSAQTTTVDVVGEETEAINSIFGVSQCTTNYPIKSITGVYKVVAGVKDTSVNYYSSFLNRTVDLTTYVVTGTPLMVDYKREGAIDNYFTGITPGIAQIVVSTPVNKEGGLSEIVSITINDVVTAETPSDPSIPEEEETIYISGPSSVRFNPPSSVPTSTPTYTSVGPWDLRSSLGNSVTQQALRISEPYTGRFVCTSTGYIQLWFGITQTIVIEMTGLCNNRNVSATMNVFVSH